MPQIAKFILIYNADPVVSHTIGKEIRRAFKQHFVFAVQDSRIAPLRHLVATGLNEKFSNVDIDAMQPELRGYSVGHLIANVKEFLEESYGEDVLDRWLHRRILRNIPVPVWTIVDDPSGSSMDCLRPYTIVEDDIAEDIPSWARKFVAELVSRSN